MAPRTACRRACRSPRRRTRRQKRREAEEAELARRRGPERRGRAARGWRPTCRRGTRRRTGTTRALGLPPDLRGHVLDLHHLPQPGQAVGAPDAALLDAAPGRGGLAEAVDAVVDGDHAGLRARPAGAGPSRASRVQPLAVRPYSLSLASRIASSSEATRHDRQHGPEGLLAHDPHRVVDARRAPWAGRSSRGPRARAPPVRTLAPRATASATCSSTMRRWRSRVSGPTSTSPLRRVAHAQLARLLHHPGDERVRHRLLDVHALHRGAGLARVEEGAPDDARARPGRGRRRGRRPPGPCRPAPAPPGVRFRAADAITCLPVATLPVNTILRDARVLHQRRRHRVVHRDHVQHARRAARACRNSSPMRRPISVVAGAGFRTTVLPAASAAATPLRRSQNG